MNAVHQVGHAFQKAAACGKRRGRITGQLRGRRHQGRGQDKLEGLDRIGIAPFTEIIPRLAVRR